MMKKSTKLMALTLTMLLSVSLIFTSCGGEKTFEEYVKSQPEIQEQMDEMKDSMQMEGLTMDIKFEGNKIIYEAKFKETADKETAKTMTEYFNEYMGTAGSIFENIAQQCEEQSEIDGITVQVLYLNGDGTELYNGTFE